MNKEQFYNIISDSSLLTNVDEQCIDEIIKEFPYFQTAYILKTKILSDKGSFKYDNFIKLASLYSVDRSKLYNYLHTDTEIKETDKTEEVITETADKIEVEQEVETEKIEPSEIKAEETKEVEIKIEPEVVEKKIESEKIKEPIAEITEEEPEIIDSEQQEIEKEKTEPIVEKPTETKKAEEPKAEKVTTEEVEIIENKIEKPEIIEETKIVEEKTEVKKDKKPTEKPEPISANATLAEKIIHKYKDIQKDEKKESIADIILRKAAEAKKQKAKQTSTEKTEPVLKKKPEEIKVEEKTFKPVKLEAKPKQKEPVKETKKEVKPKVEKPTKEFKKVKPVAKKETQKEKEPKIDILEEINKISEKETVSDYFSKEEVVETKPAKEKMSFEDWLNFVDTPIQTSNKNKNQTSLIDKFISAEADIKIKSNPDSETDSEQLIKSGELERDDFITETLANIYIKQKLYEKAITAFTKLSLKYPKKNSYFADRIKKVEKLIKK